MTAIQKLEKHYDFVLVGCTLGSLALANLLKKQGRKFCILDSDQTSSNQYKYLPSADQFVYTRVPLTSISDTSDAMIESIQQLPWDLPQTQIVEGPPLHFDKGQFRSFVGFGDAKIDAIDEYMYFCATETLTCPEQPEKLWQRLLTEVEEQIFYDEEITEIIFADKSVAELTLNGKQTLTASNYVFFKRLDWILDEMGRVDNSLAPRLKKTKWFSSVNLIFHHEEFPANYELNRPYLLKGSKEQPCVGIFSSLNGQAISRWQTFMPAELVADAETVGAAVKEVKRQVKRAFNDLFGKSKSEQIIIHDRIVANLDQIGDKASNFSNLTIVSPALSGQRGWLHELLLADQYFRQLESPGTEAPLSL